MLNKSRGLKEKKKKKKYWHVKWIKYCPKLSIKFVFLSLNEWNFRISYFKSCIRDSVNVKCGYRNLQMNVLREIQYAQECITDGPRHTQRQIYLENTDDDPQ